MLSGLPIIVYLYDSMLAEENFNTGKFGDAYLRYMRRVPKANLLLGAVRMMRHTRKGAAK